jgi:endo-beta-N-acetylglucosaminidase D
MTYIISLEQDRKWYGVSSLYLNKHKTIINTTATTFDVTKGSPWDLVCSLVTHKLVWPVVSCQLVLLLLLLPKQTFDIIKSVLWSLS